MSEEFTEADRTRAVMQGEQNAASEAYFEPRPALDFLPARRVFDAGFERGWEAAMRSKGGAA